MLPFPSRREGGSVTHGAGARPPLGSELSQGDPNSPEVRLLSQLSQAQSVWSFTDIPSFPLGNLLPPAFLLFIFNCLLRGTMHSNGAQGPFLTGYSGVTTGGAQGSL